MVESVAAGVKAPADTFETYASENPNVGTERVLENIRTNSALDLPWLLQETRGHKKQFIIVGGGPSLKETWPRIKKNKDAVICAVNGAYDFLLERGIVANIHLLFDAMPDLTKFLKNKNKKTLYLVASQCDPGVFEELKGQNTIIWHGDGSIFHDDIKSILSKHNRPWTLIGGGETAAHRGFYIALLMGFKEIEFFGVDASLSDSHHAYEQDGYDGREVIEVYAMGKAYKCWPAHFRQAGQFKFIYRNLVERGCSVKSHGKGLIPDICRELNRQTMEKKNGKYVQDE